MKSRISCSLCTQEDGIHLTQVCKGSTSLHTIHALTRVESVSAAPLRLWKIWALSPRTGTLSATAHGCKPLEKWLHADCIATKKGYEPHWVRRDEKQGLLFLMCLFIQWCQEGILPQSALKDKFYPEMKHCVVCLFIFFLKKASLTLLSVCVQNHICWSQDKNYVLMFFLSQVNLLELILSERMEFLLYLPLKPKFLRGVQIFLKYAILIKQMSGKTCLVSWRTS